MTIPADAPVQLVWPALLRPSAPTQLVYLDMNHWIGLSQAATGHPQGAGYQGALEACRTARSAGLAVFPLSAAHYIEMSAIKHPRQRQNLAAVMEELSGFATLMDRLVVIALEVHAVLDVRARVQVPTATTNLLGFGLGPAFGMRGGLRIRDVDGRDVTDRHTTTLDGAAMLAEANLQLERALLAGPSDQELPALVERGYDPVAAIKVAVQRAAEEDAQRLRLDAVPRWRRGRLRDVVAARELRIELWDIVDKALAVRGLAADDVLGSQTQLRQFLHAMPSTEVAITLKTTRHRNGALRWTANDITDIDALSLAVPYCDLVVTEKFAHHMLTSTRIAERMNTVVMSSISDLPGHLA